VQVASLIKNSVSPHHHFANEILRIRQLLSKDWNIVINHTFQEGNACADLLAKMGAFANSPLVILEEPPPQVLIALQVDAWV
jgi:hypothetical protein